MAGEQPRTFRIEQLGPPRGPRGIQTNERVSDLDGIETHHPGANRHIRMQDGRILDAEDQRPGYDGGDRAYAYINGDFQEVIDRSADRYGSLKPDQVLMVKDFILEDPTPPRGTDARAIGVPSPAAGYVSRIRDSGGLVEIMDRRGGDVIARVRHLDPIAVREGDTVAYGQSLGTQDNKGLPARAGVHVHLEMDTARHQELENYIEDLRSGRLPVQAEFRTRVRPQPIVSDGTFRLGQADERIADLQRVMAGEGYRASNDRSLDQDGVYRPSMQGALLDFQRTHGLPQTGDIDPATLRMAPSAPRREADIQDHVGPVRSMFQAPPTTPTAPRHPDHPDHPDHRPHLPRALPHPVNQHRGPQASTDMRDPGHIGHGAYRQAIDVVARFEDSQGIRRGPHTEQFSASLAVMVERENFSLSQLERGPGGQILAVQNKAYSIDERRMEVDARAALSQSVEQHSTQWAQLRSPHYASDAPAAERTQAQSQALSQLSPNDQAIFAKLRNGLPAHISDDVVAVALYATKKEGINRPDQIAATTIAGDRLFVLGTTPGFRTFIDIEKPAPSAHETVQQTQALNQEQLFAQQDAMQRSQSSPKMAM